MSDKPKLGAGHLGAMARQGLAELRAAMYPESNIAQPTEYGMAGRPTPQEVVSSKEGHSRDVEESVIESRVGVEPAQEPESLEGRDAPEIDRE